MKPIYWIIGGIAAFIIYRKYKMANSLTYKINGFNISGDITAPVLVISLQIYNPTTVSADIQSINADLLVNNSIVGIVNSNEKQTIAANTSTIINIPISVNLTQAITDVIAIIKNKSANINVKGSLTVDFIPIPFDIQYNI